MRLRNVKGAKEQIENSKYVIIDYKKYYGKFHTLFNNNHPIHIEIGMGKGQFIINMARKNPDINYIGIEKYDSVMVRALEKLKDEHLPNLYFLRLDAVEIDQVFKKEIDKIYLNFSDPWPKVRHTNRRLTSSIFLKRYDAIFRQLKEIEFKTDNRHLFEYSVQSLTTYGYYISDLCLDLYDEDVVDNVSTEYEDKFHSKGFPIYKICVIKK